MRGKHDLQIARFHDFADGRVLAAHSLRVVKVTPMRCFTELGPEFEAM